MCRAVHWQLPAGLNACGHWNARDLTAALSAMEPIDGRARAAAAAVLRFGSAAARAALCPAPGRAADDSLLSSSFLCGVFRTTFATCTHTEHSDKQRSWQSLLSMLSQLQDSQSISACASGTIPDSRRQPLQIHASHRQEPA